MKNLGANIFGAAIVFPTIFHFFGKNDTMRINIAIFLIGIYVVLAIFLQLCLKIHHLKKDNARLSNPPKPYACQSGGISYDKYS